MLITLKDYYKNRDIQFAKQLTATIVANARLMVARTNALLARFYLANPQAARRTVNSGWRPPAVNRGVKDAAPRSHHLTARACDLSDDDEQLDKWLLTKSGQAALVEIGLWMEHPSATPRWCHIQIVAPPSGNRVFLPR